MTQFDYTDGVYFDYSQVGPVNACINYANDPQFCGGSVITVTSRSGLTTSNKCQHCRDRVSEALAKVDERYPDTAQPPDWFDPTYAGESWDGE